MKNIQIGKKVIGAEEPPFIIAEAGSNHNRKLEQAKKLIDVAVEAGVDAIKFQTFSAEKLVAETKLKAKHLNNVSEESSTHEIFRKIELPREWHIELARYAEEKGVIFLSSPFDEEAVDLLDEIGVPAFKIASGDITNLPLLKYAARKMKPLILSTGASTLGEIDEAVSSIREVGNEKIILLHCVASYPTSMEDANLTSIVAINNAFNLPTGYSDHTLGIIAPIVAVTMGAVVIEKHFTLSRNMVGPDHFYAIEPAELKTMVENLRAVKKLKGASTKQVVKTELECRKLGRRSIYATVDIPSGSTITKEMLSILRPAIGLDPKFIDIVIGRKAVADIHRYEPITWDKI